MVQRQLLTARRISLPPLREVDLTVLTGDFTAILGPPGAGKSTLLRVLALEERPAAGDLFWQGRLVTRLPAPDLAELRQSAVRLLRSGAVPPAEAGPLPPLLLADLDPPDPDLFTRLRRCHARGHTVVLATAEPEVAAACQSIYRLKAGLLRPITPLEGSL